MAGEENKENEAGVGLQMPSSTSALPQGTVQVSQSAPTTETQLVDAIVSGTDGASALDGPFPSDSDAEDRDYTYRHRTIRNWSIGDFEFNNHILVCHGADERDRFVALLARAPEVDRNQIVEWNPEVLKDLEKPVDYTRSSTIRGAQSTGSITDPKTNPGGPGRVDPLAAFRNRNPSA